MNGAATPNTPSTSPFHAASTTSPDSSNKNCVSSRAPPLKLRDLPRYHPANFEYRHQQPLRSPRGSPQLSPRLPTSPTHTLRNSRRAETQPRAHLWTHRPPSPSYFHSLQSTRATLSPNSSDLRSRAWFKPTSPHLDPVQIGVEGPMTPLFLEEERADQATSSTKIAGCEVEKEGGRTGYLRSSHRQAP